MAGSVFKPLKNKDFSAHPRTCILGHLHPPGDPGAPIDEALLTYFPAPASYTGEDVIEVSVHGGAAVQRGALGAALAAGARLAEPGEFTRRAYLNGKMDLAQAEAVAGLIAAEGERARRLLLCQAEGALGQAARRMKGELLAAQATLTAALDFPEDVEDLSLAEAWEKVAQVGDEAARLARMATEGVGLSEGFTVVLTGPPNAGKSSLLNALLGEDRAIVHPAAGTTRDPVEGVIRLDGIAVSLVDTAGVPASAGEDLDEVEAEGVRRAQRRCRTADLVLAVEDAARLGAAIEGGQGGSTEGAPRLRILNKCDLLSVPPPVSGGVTVSALTGEGVDRLRTAILRALLGEGQPAGDGAVPVTLRQKAGLEEVAAACRRVGEGVREGAPPECLGVDLADGLRRLGELVGEDASEEVLEAVFSRFCVGK